MTMVKYDIMKKGETIATNISNYPEAKAKAEFLGGVVVRKYTYYDEIQTRNILGVRHGRGKS